MVIFYNRWHLFTSTYFFSRSTWIFFRGEGWVCLPNFLYFWCYFFVLFLVVLFLFFIKVFRFQRKTLLFLLGFFFPIIILFLIFCSADFSKTPRSIFMKFSHMKPYDKMLIHFFLFWWRHFRFRKIDDFVIFDRSFCPDRFSKMGKERHLKFSRMIDKRLKLCKICFKCI